MTVFLIIITVLCIILLLPVRVKGAFGDGKWSVSVYYTLIRVFHKESAPPVIPQTPPQPAPDADTPAPPDPESEPAPKPKKKRKKKPKKPDPPAQPAAAPKPPGEIAEPVPETAPETASETGAAPVSQETLAGSPESSDQPASSAEKPKKKRGIKAFIERLKPHSLSDIFGLIGDGKASLSPSLRFLLRHLHFRHVKLYLAVASEEPDKTALNYGRISAAAYRLLGALQCVLDIEADEFRILADFYGTKTTFRASLELRCSPAALLMTALILGGKFLWRSWRRFRREDKEAALREKETAPLPVTE